jgi:hypothetical protein
MNYSGINFGQIEAKARLLNVIIFCCQTCFPQLQKVARKSKIEFETQPPSFGVCFVEISVICEFPDYKENQWIEESS